MPATPKYALRYPALTGVAPDVPYYMQQLAEDVEETIDEVIAAAWQAGTSTIPAAAGAPQSSVVVAFPVAFPAGTTPSVMVTSGSYVVHAGATGISNTGFTLIGRRVDGSNFTSAVSAGWEAKLP